MYENSWKLYILTEKLRKQVPTKIRSWSESRLRSFLKVGAGTTSFSSTTLINRVVELLLQDDFPPTRNILYNRGLNIRKTYSSRPTPPKKLISFPFMWYAIIYISCTLFSIPSFFVPNFPSFIISLFTFSPKYHPPIIPRGRGVFFYIYTCQHNALCTCTVPRY